MESAVLLYIVVTLMMSSGARGQSFSRSCSTVNGKTVCESQQNQGNMAASSSQAVSGGSNGDYQNAYAGAGNPNDWSSSQTQQGVAPSGVFPGFVFGFPNFGGGSTGGGASSASQSASGSGTGNQGGYQQGSSSFSSSSSGDGNNQGSYQASSGPGTFTYTSTSNNGGGAVAGGFAGAGAYAGPLIPGIMSPFQFVFGGR
ncbi:keratin, type II cytoskeletal 2 epidermal-like isoform X1 [Uloborus diversus]|uniref:keratin, type II cytoskeletal 2 epidermal-like isoform X1 n=1 Tax=Uloborus diversus TaxID=327109 RepID=UPI00240A3D76|nr:keratin, type II cytoskeletal 2 epidermal-like isoform X1 [Uloborus diversus]